MLCFLRMFVLMLIEKSDLYFLVVSQLEEMFFFSKYYFISQKIQKKFTLKYCRLIMHCVPSNCKVLCYVSKFILRGNATSYKLQVAQVHHAMYTLHGRSCMSVVCSTLITM